jgi:hypothetical protein
VESAPARASCTPTARLSAAETRIKERAGTKYREAQRNNLNGCSTAGRRYAASIRSGRPEARFLRLILRS